MAITIVNLRSMVDKPGAPPYPASGYTLHKDDWNLMRSALTTGQGGLWAKGIKLGSEGMELVDDTPIVIPDESFILFQDGGADDAVMGSISHDGELAMRSIRIGEREVFAGGSTVVVEGDRELQRAESERTHDTVVRGDAQIEDLDIFNDGDVFSLRILSGTFLSDAQEHGFAWRNADGVSQVFLDDDGNLILRDVVDPTARPWTYENERQIITGVDGSGLVADVIGVDGINVEEVLPSPRVLTVGLLEAGVASDRLDVGPGTAQVNVDDLWNRGGGSGTFATLVTPAERAQVGDHETRLAVLEAEIVLKISALRTAAGLMILPTPTGYVQLVDSSSVIFDRPGPNSLRGVSAGGGGGGGIVDSVTAGAGLGNSGTTTNPILDVKLSDGLVFDGDEVAVDFGGSGAAVTASRSDHDHAGVYSLVGHTHTGTYVPVAGAYADLSASSKIGTGAGQVAAGDDVRFHTQNTDLGTTSKTFILRRGFAGAPNNSDELGIVAERGSSTDARVFFNETLDRWAAGIVGSEQVIILDDDARLSNARAPTPHVLDSVSHTGDLAGSRVAIALAPSEYTPAGADVEGHLAGIDSELGTKIGAGDGRLGGQLISVSVHSTDLLAAAELLGNGVASGLPILNGGSIARLVVQAQKALAGGTSITFRVKNLTQPTEFDDIVINAGQKYASGAASIVVAAGDEIGISCQGLVGIPDAGVINVYAVKGA